MTSRSILILLLAMLLTPTFGQSRADDAPDQAIALRYVVRMYDPSDERVQVHVTIDDIPESLSTLTMRMSQGFAFARPDAPLINDDVAADGDDAMPVEIQRVDPWTWRIDTAGAAMIDLVYSVPLTHRRLNAVVDAHDQYEWPYVDADHALLHSGAMFMIPQLPKSIGVGDIRVALEISARWPVTAPWPTAAGREFEPPSVQALANDYLAIGRWERHEIEVGDFRGTIVIAPGQPGLAEAVVEPIRRIVEFELHFFAERPQGRYLFIFGRPDVRGFAGSPKTGSMTLAIAPQMLQSPDNDERDHVAHLVAHEFFHTWSQRHFAAPDELRFFNEGFTDYYAYQISARLGLISWTSFAETLGDAMTAMEVNELRPTTALTDAGGPMFFKRSAAYDMVYQGGMVLAAWLDQAIRVQGDGLSLDEFMHAFINDPQWSLAGPAPTLDDLLAALRLFIDDGSLIDHFAVAVRTPGSFDIVKSFAMLGIEITRAEGPVQRELRANFDGTRITAIDPACGAAMLGLQTGDEIVSIDGVEVLDERAAYQAWQSAGDDRIVVVYRRNDETHTIDAPFSRRPVYHVPPDIWAR